MQKYNIEYYIDSANQMILEILNFKFVEKHISSLKKYSRDTFDHSIRVAIISILVGYNIELNKNELYELALGALFHDIGKLCIPLTILNKTTDLTNEEYAIIKKHPLNGYNILLDNGLFTKNTKLSVYQHHEFYNGKGYPQGLVNNEINRFAMIVHICDVFDAIVTKRSYKKALSIKEAICILKKQRGKMFDPLILDSFLEIIPDNFDKISFPVIE